MKKNHFIRSNNEKMPEELEITRETEKFKNSIFHKRIKLEAKILKPY